MNEQAQDNRDQRYVDKYKSLWQFAVGFLGWYLVNGLVWLAITGDPGPITDEGDMISGVFVFLANLLFMFLLFLSKETRLFAAGLIAAVGVNLLISLILELLTNALCFIPFFRPLH